SDGAVASGDRMFAAQKMCEAGFEFLNESALGRDPIGAQAFVDIGNLGFGQFRGRDHVFHRILETRSQASSFGPLGSSCLKGPKGPEGPKGPAYAAARAEG